MKNIRIVIITMVVSFSILWILDRQNKVKESDKCIELMKENSRLRIELQNRKVSQSYLRGEGVWTLKDSVLSYE